MAEPTADPQLREALDELQLYFSDSIPPLVAAGSVELLIRQPVEILAGALDGWIGAQYRRGAGTSVPLSDYLFHAVKKIHLMKEYRLVPDAVLEPYLEDLKRAVLVRCPPEDRDLLAQNLSRLAESAASSVAAPVDRLFRQIGGERASVTQTAGGAAAGPAPNEAALHRFSAFLERFEAESRIAGEKRAPSPETLAAAARRSESAREIEEYLSRLQTQGLAVGTADVFQALARSLPAWTPPASAPEWVEAAAQSPAVEAMRRMVSEAPDSSEGARRFQELVRAAVDRFNEGSLPQAVATLELAERLVSEKKVDAGTVDVARRRGDQDLDPERLRKYAETSSLHPSLRKVLLFFSELAPDALLTELKHEPKRDRRRLLLGLLEAHGDVARAAALEALAGSPDGSPEDAYFRRNLLYLVRRIPRPATASPSEEIDAAARHADPALPAVLVKEAIAALGQIHDEKAELVLKHLLGRIEEELGRPGESPQEPKELMSLLDRTASALARLGTPGGRRAVVDHALSKDPKLGDAMARLSELGGQDLREDPELVGRLLGIVRSNLPVKVLGLVLHQKDQNAMRAIEALAGTPSPEVRAALEEVVSRFPEKDVGKAASRALAGFRKAAPAEAAPAASLTGDLEVFGLPALLQSLSDSSHAGVLSLADSRGQPVGTIRIKSGKFRSCRAGALSGKEALYQLLERPAPGSFQFVRSDAPDPDASATGTLLDFMPIVLEGMRRNDELRAASALVPDDARLAATEVRATPHPGESDGMLTKTLWTRVTRGASPRECEAEIATDAYRIRRLLAHWVESGALKVEAPGRATA